VLVAVIADTHLPKGARRLPELCLEWVARADALIHAGDFATVGVLRELEAICPEVYAVHGNVDEPALRRLLPASRQLELGGRRIALVHDAGAARGRLERMKDRFPGAEAVVFGHSHIPLHERSSGFQIFNPGSPTERRRAPHRAMGLLRVSRSGLRFDHVWLDAL
jgi:putative phosphoesterase